MSCVISDVRMPSMSGVELQPTCFPRGRHVPFIFITAFRGGNLRAAMKAGAIGF